MFIKSRSDSDRYKVRVVKPGSKGSLSAPPDSKPVRVLKAIGRKITAAFVAVLMLALAFLAAIGTAAPAHANVVTDSFSNAFCTEGHYFYEPVTHTFLRPTTGDASKWDATGYEKYGTAGMQWTVWHGPQRQEGLDKQGEFGGKGIVSFLGGQGKTDIDQVGDDVASAKKGEATQALPGFYNTSASCHPVLAVASTGLANALLGATSLVVWVSNFIYEAAATSGTVIAMIGGDTLKTVSNAFKDALFLEFLSPLVMIGALWMAWEGLVKKSSTKAIGGAFWMLIAATGAVAIMTSPMAIPNVAAKVIGAVSAETLTATSNWSGETGGLCAIGASAPVSDALKPGEKPKAPEIDTEKEVNKSIRSLQCQQWDAFLYTPWVMGQFGVSPATMDEDSPLKQGWNEALSGGPLNGQPQMTPVKRIAGIPEEAQGWAIYQLDNRVKQDKQGGEKTAEQKKALTNVALAQLHKDDYNADYKGENGGNRLGLAVLALVSAVGAGAVIVVIAGRIIMAQIGMVLLMLVFPIYALAGVVPGYGPKVLGHWGHQVAGMIVKQIILSLYLSVFLLFFSALLKAEFTGGFIEWMIKLLLIVLLSFFALKFQKTIIEDLMRFLPGSGNSGASTGGGSGSDVARGGTGAVGGAVGAAAVSKFTQGRVSTVKKGMDAVAERLSSGAGKRPKAVNDTRMRAAQAMKQERVQPTSSTRAQERVQPTSSTRAQERVQPDSARAQERVQPDSSTQPQRLINPDPRQVAKDLKKAGYRSSVGVGSIAKAAFKGAVVGGVTGRPMAGIAAGVGVVRNDRLKQEKRNDAAVEKAAEQARIRARFDGEPASPSSRKTPQDGKSTDKKPASGKGKLPPVPPRPRVPEAPTSRNLPTAGKPIGLPPLRKKD